MTTRRQFISVASAAAVGGAFCGLPPASTEPIVTTGRGRRVLSGNERFPDGFTVPSGEIWEFDPDKTTTVEAGGNVIVEGTLRMRPARSSVKHTLRFVDVDESSFEGGGMDVKATDVGLWVMGTGRLRLMGSEKSAWVRKDRPAGWRGTDRVVVCPNRAGDDDPQDFRQMTWRNRRRPAPVKFAGRRFHTEILNLERNVSIEGTARGRAHCLIRSSARQVIKYVAFRHLGVAGKMGRYPLHFHHCGDGSRRSVVAGCLVHMSGHRAFVPHASHGITFKDCVAYDVGDNPFWWDKRERDGSGSDRSRTSDSHDTTFRNCVAARVTRGKGEGFLAGFTLGGGSGNACIGCVAVGIDGGKDAAGYEWPSQANKPPNHWTFRNNVVHNTKGNGVYVWQNSGSAHVNANTVAYHCGNSSVLHGAYGNRYQWTGLTILGGEEGIHLHAATSAVEADDIGDPTKAQHPQRWSGVSIVGAAVGLAVSRTLGGDGLTPVVLRDIEFTDCTAIVKRVATKGDKTPRLIDIIHPIVDGGPMTPDMIDLAGAHAASKVRVRNLDGSSFTVDGSGRVEATAPSTPA